MYYDCDCCLNIVTRGMAKYRTNWNLRLFDDCSKEERVHLDKQITLVHGEIRFYWEAAFVHARYYAAVFTFFCASMTMKGEKT